MIATLHHNREKGGSAAAAMTPACPKPTKNQSYAEPAQLSRPEYSSQSPTHHADTQISPITLKCSAPKTPREKSGIEHTGSSRAGVLVRRRPSPPRRMLRPVPARWPRRKGRDTTRTSRRCGRHRGPRRPPARAQGRSDRAPCRAVAARAAWSPASPRGRMSEWPGHRRIRDSRPPAEMPSAHRVLRSRGC